MSKAQAHEPGRAVVVGGSLAGLFTGLALRHAGWQVELFERSAGRLDDRGAGLVLQPEVLALFARVGASIDAPLGVEIGERVYLDRDGHTQTRLPLRQVGASWSRLYTVARRAFGEHGYLGGERLEGLELGPSSVAARFASGRQTRGELLVGADGAGSTVRRLLLPEVEERYAGYVAYRGLVDEGELDSLPAQLFTGRFVIQSWPGSHILSYPVPGASGSSAAGRRRFNWVWYINLDGERELPRVLTDRDGQLHPRSLPPGRMAPAVAAELQQRARQLLAPQFAALVAATREPFVQPIVDLAVPWMAIERVALLGDAAIVLRPHTAASSAKAAADALSLADQLTASGHEVAPALSRWETTQLAYGRQLFDYGRELGRRSQAPREPPR